MHSREIRLKSRPVGMPKVSDFEIAARDLGELADGEVRVRNRFISTDPYMRGRMMAGPSYATPFPLDEPIPGRAMGEVTQSRAAGFAAGDIVRSMAGWREAFDAAPQTLEKIETGGISPHHFIAAAGVPGLSAHAGLTRIAGLKAGETVFISAASGAVGAIACQLARLTGARVVGSAGGAEKTGYLREIGVDAVIDYKSVPDLSAALLQAAPQGIDVYFDNVGGDHLQAALNAARPYARVAICGMISGYNATAPVPGPSNLALIVGKSLKIEGFRTADHMDMLSDFTRRMKMLIASGEIKTRETFHEGIEATPGAFISLFTGANFGKPLVTIP